MSKLERFFPELIAVPQKCKCGKPATDKNGITRFLDGKAVCKECYRRRMGKDAEEKLVEAVKKAAIKTGEQLAARSLERGEYIER